ncbi:unnamed protein product [Thelazia callipaeda]|uniref:Fcf2 domain-containing protein n=1 Tax=Thelazia callipaeda TaxID=103827 RepID=A0A0N5D517_THECL|nr:unnamed protein product [Thelazia callipaeda]
MFVARFAALHQKLIEKQPTLQESDAKVKRKFVEHEKAVPEIFKRLATSKKPESKVIIKARSPGYRFKNVGEDPLKINYSFPKLDRIKNAPVDLQNCTKVSSQTRVMRERRIGVKELSKKFITKQVRRSPRFVKLVEAKSAVTPQLTARLKRLATPKGKTPEVSLTESEKKALVKCGRRYLPRRGRVLPYVDTTAMTDNQFYEAKRRGDIQSFTAVTRNQKRQEMLVKRKEARDQIFRSKRNY